MLRILERLDRSFTWRLLPPLNALTDGRSCGAEDQDHSRWRAKLQAARADTFDSSLPHPAMEGCVEVMRARLARMLSPTAEASGVARPMQVNEECAR